MTTDAQVRDWLLTIDAGVVEFRLGRFHDDGMPVERSANKILTGVVMSGWAAKSGSAIKLTAEGRTELGAAR